MAGSKLERDFQAKLIKEIKSMFRGCLVMKLDSAYIQGIPDLLILWNDRWATLECKKSVHAARQPNQDYYVRLMNQMSFSRFISPENKEEVLRELYESFRADRSARIPECEQIPLAQLRRRKTRSAISRSGSDQAGYRTSRFCRQLYRARNQASIVEEDPEYVCE